ncbi:hypothetical protein K443DRAFT_686864 [Laccaria amethystina LaAM-08-1]|uniref:Unplaced genomic scaffold K443scaffold_687, whole genome shotgun sequence n=1 Tax=Laccaria amethystina LaAM-08-1 TaxID=1095629 RepID=A0A0C9WLH4_9AGAR|nr:hypothetical protein K443DRAFT_686864 [Laccaria amethystina LaAM-08-1]
MDMKPCLVGLLAVLGLLVDRSRGWLLPDSVKESLGFDTSFSANSLFLSYQLIPFQRRRFLHWMLPRPLLYSKPSSGDARTRPPLLSHTRYPNDSVFKAGQAVEQGYQYNYIRRRARPSREAPNVKFVIIVSRSLLLQNTRLVLVSRG